MTDAHPVGEVQADQRREQHVRGRHPGQRQQAQRQECGDAVDLAAAEEPDGDADQRDQGEAVQPQQSGQPRRGRPEDRERDDGQRGEDAGLGAGHAEVVTDLVEHRPDADRGRPQVEGEYGDAEQHQAAARQAWAGSSGLVRSRS